MGEESRFYDEFLQRNNLHDLKPEQLKALEEIEEQLPSIDCESIIPSKVRTYPKSKQPGPNKDPEFEPYYTMARIYSSIEQRAERCKTNIIIASGLEMKLGEITPQYAVKDLLIGHITEEGFTKLLGGFGKHEKDFRSWWNLSESITSAFDSIAALWWYATRLVFHFYSLEGLTDKTYNFHNTLQHERIKDRMLPFWNHLKLGQEDSPLKKVTELRNINNHREDLMTALHGKLMYSFDVEECGKVFKGLREQIGIAKEGYVHFAEGYGILLKQFEMDEKDF